ncbi:MAG: hypothetical protein ACLSS9_15675 [Acutalibacteraceae bacterium]
MDDMMRKVNEYPNGTFLRIIWASGEFIVEGLIDTIYETDNGMDLEDEGYREYYACAVMVKKVIYHTEPFTPASDRLMELSVNNQPSSIELKDGTVIWRE